MGSQELRKALLTAVSKSPLSQTAASARTKKGWLKRERARHGLPPFKPTKVIRSSVNPMPNFRHAVVPNRPTRPKSAVAAGPRGKKPVALTSEGIKKGAKDSLELHMPGGNLTPERKALHEQIIKQIMGDVKPVANPTYYVMGGGPASGKSSVIKSGSINLPDKHSAVHIDADQIKGMLPEARQLNGIGDSSWPSWVHEESSMLAKEIQKRALAQHMNVVLDGTGDSSYESLAKKVAQARASGHKVVANYATVDTADAVKRNAERGKVPGDDGLTRLVPESIVTGTHASVSRILPQAMKDGLFDEAHLWDTSGPPDEPPVHVAVAVGGGKKKNTGVHILNEDAWTRFLQKGHEKATARPFKPTPVKGKTAGSGRAPISHERNPGFVTPLRGMHRNYTPNKAGRPSRVVFSKFVRKADFSVPDFPTDQPTGDDLNKMLMAIMHGVRFEESGLPDAWAPVWKDISDEVDAISQTDAGINPPADIPDTSDPFE